MRDSCGIGGVVGRGETAREGETARGGDTVVGTGDTTPALSAARSDSRWGEVARPASSAARGLRDSCCIVDVARCAEAVCGGETARGGDTVVGTGETTPALSAARSESRWGDVARLASAATSGGEEACGGIASGDATRGAGESVFGDVEADSARGDRRAAEAGAPTGGGEWCCTGASSSRVGSAPVIS